MDVFHSSSQNTTSQDQLTNNPGTIITGLSGNELYCVAMAGYSPGHVLMGNSVYALGFFGGIASNIHTTIGGEIPQFTNMISEGRRLSLQRFEQELAQVGGAGAAGVTSELVFHPGNVEFLSVGSSLYLRDGSRPQQAMTSSADGQELFCQIDAGFQPLSLALGNVAYSIGVGSNFMGSIRQLAHGEVRQYSDIFNTTRNLALRRICEDGRRYGANSVVGIRTSIIPIGVNGVHEMVMVGTASYHPKLGGEVEATGELVTSDLTSEEMWNVTKLGYAPVRLVLGTSVYSLGVVGGLKAALRGIAKGEISSLTEMVYGAREESLKKIQTQAAECGADMVLGTKMYIYQLGGDLIELLAIGTAVKRVDGIAPRSPQLPPQAIIRDKDTFVDTAESSFGTTLNHQTNINGQTQTV